ncbi:RNA polymerase sigma factor [Lentisphaera marina]|uniref:RNA polymerase sigma factor n=1 Tax=Lentisphaera marina TaxID=1111041 RepID=UPI002365FD75|nr:RNA polymerase sigma factor [Lentisphaera marina]MDD7987256.1 RNA polymerase sigma factor [Lentisphaera marina]
MLLSQKHKMRGCEVSEDRFVTRKTLLQRASCGEDGQAWDEFVAYYEKFIFILLWHLSVPQQECDDISQKVLVKLWRNLANYDPSKAKFRTWIGTIIRNATATHMAQRSQQGQRFPLFDTNERMLSEQGADEFEQFYQKEWESYITSIAMKNVSECFSGKAIEVFKMSLSGCTPQEIADKLDLQLSSVYSLKKRVKARAIEEVKRLRNELEL